MKLFISVACVVACALPCAALAEPAGFEDQQVQQMEAIVQRAVERALANQGARTGEAPIAPATIDAADAPWLPEGKRQALEAMIDVAIQRALAGARSSEPAVPAAPVPDARIACLDTEVAPDVTDLRRERFAALEAARAQGFDPEAADCALRQRTVTAGEALRLTDTGLNSAPSTPKASDFQLIANGSGARVSLKVDRSSAEGDVRGSAKYWSRSAVFSAPIDKDDEVGTGLVDLDGLTNGFELTYNATRIRTAPLGHLKIEGDSLLFAMLEACRALGIADGKCELSTLLQVAGERSILPGKAGADAQAIAARYSVPGRAWLQGFRLKIGHDDYVHYDPSSLAKRTQDEVSWGAGVFTGILTGNAYYAAGIDYQRAYKGARSSVACPAPSDGGSVVLCVNGALGPPSVTERHLLSAEGRWRFGDRALGVRAVHDFRNSNTGVDVPIYLFPDKDGLLTGGLRLGWTDEEKFYAAIFVGVPFALTE